MWRMMGRMDMETERHIGQEGLETDRERQAEINTGRNTGGHGDREACIGRGRGRQRHTWEQGVE